MPGHHTSLSPAFDVPFNVFGGDSGMEGEAGPLRAPFQVLVRLQYLRAEVSSWNRDHSQGLADGQLENVKWGLRGLAGAALDCGAGAYAAICLECAARVAHVCRSGMPPAELRNLLGAWLASSDAYLRHPTRAAAAADLVARFVELSGEAETLNTTGQGILFRALLFPL